MPIKLHIDKARDLTTFTVTGVLIFDKAMPVIKDFYYGEPTKHVVWDLIDTTDVTLTSKEVEAIVSFRPRYKGKRASGKTTFIAQEEFLFGLSRMFELQSSFHKAPYPIMSSVTEMKRINGLMNFELSINYILTA